MTYRPNLINILLLSALLTLSGCMPISEYDNTSVGTGISGAAIGAVAAGGTAAVLGAPKPVIGFFGLTGAGIGYYLTTLRFASRGIIQAGGKVYTEGDFIIIEVPTDHLFDTNTAEFLPGTEPVLDSIVSALKRYPCNNIIISASTSGFGTQRFQQKLSESRASQVASYLWLRGIGAESKIKDTEIIKGRTLMYVGYGDLLPIANDLHLESIRSNSRIQIVGYLGYQELHWNQYRKHYKHFQSIGSMSDSSTGESAPINYSDSFSADHMPDNTDTTKQIDFNKEFPPEASAHSYRFNTHSRIHHRRSASAFQTTDGDNL